MTYEAWRISYQSSEQAARVAYAECVRLQAKIEVMERQEPVAWLHETRPDSGVVTDAVKLIWEEAVARALAAYSIPLCLAPGAQAQPAPSVPEGWKLVPIEPTPGMIDAAEYVDWGDADVRGSCINAWDRMLAATREAKP